jgi:aminoglycoside phosphotransferase (APT) family kinase protein
MRRPAVCEYRNFSLWHAPRDFDDDIRVTTTHDLTRIAEGREAEIYAWEDGAVLRLFRDARSGAALSHERRAMAAARAAVPSVPAILGETEVDGRPGLIMERVDGPDLLTVLGSKPWRVWTIGTICGDQHARLHAAAAPPELASARESISLHAASVLPQLPAQIAEAASRVLAAAPDGGALLHGDFHPGNILMSSRGPVVIDWGNATRGDPHADVARTLLLVGGGALPPGTPLAVRAAARAARKIVRAAYLRAYRRVRPLDMRLVERWLFVRAVERLSESIEEEQPMLLRMLEDAYRGY